MESRYKRNHFQASDIMIFDIKLFIIATFKKNINVPANRNNPDLNKENGFPLTLYNRRLSDSINALAKSGFAVERIVEETDLKVSDNDYAFRSQFYSPYKAQKFPQSIVFKSRKL